MNVTLTKPPETHNVTVVLDPVRLVHVKPSEITFTNKTWNHNMPVTIWTPDNWIFEEQTRHDIIKTSIRSDDVMYGNLDTFRGGFLTA